MAPVTVALDVYRGDDHHWTFPLYTDPAQTVPDDLAGAAAKAEIRAVSGGAVLAALACTVTLPNIVDVALAAADTVTLPAGRLKWDLQLTFPAGKRTAVAGPVVVTADVTDSDDLKVNPL